MQQLPKELLKEYGLQYSDSMSSLITCGDIREHLEQMQKRIPLGVAIVSIIIRANIRRNWFHCMLARFGMWCLLLARLTIIDRPMPE
jgi:hypothetical protein